MSIQTLLQTTSLYPASFPKRVHQTTDTHISSQCLGKSDDPITFGHRTTLPAELADRVTLVQPDQLSPAYKKNVQAAIRKTWQTFSPKLRKALLENGYRIKVPPTPLDAFTELEDIYTPARAAEKVSKFKANIQAKMSREDFMDSLNRIQQHEPDGSVAKALRSIPNWEQHPEQTLRALVFQQNYKSRDLEQILGKHSGTNFYWDDPRLIILAEGVRKDIPEADPDFWNRMDKSVTTLEPGIRHESFHFIDSVLGSKVGGQPFSEMTDFRKRILKDKANAEKKGIWPHPESRIETGPRKGWVLDHYFSPYLESNDPKKANAAFKEAFAEIGTSLTGPGQVDPEQVQAIYPSASKWVAKEVLSQWNQDGQQISLFGRIRRFFSSLLDHIKNWFHFNH